MKLIKKLPTQNKTPFTFYVDSYNKSTAYKLLSAVITNAHEVIEAVSEAFKDEWKNKPSTSVRAVFGHWLVKAVRHLAATITLCEEHDLSVVAGVHHRQIIELFLQVRYYASVNQAEKEEYAEKIAALGCVEYLEKMDVLKEHSEIKGAYEGIIEKLTLYDEDLVREIKRERKKRFYYWFGRSFSQLAKEVSREDEDLRSSYQSISADIHGAWNLAIDVDNPKPGVLDFRGYPDKKTMYIRAAEMLDQTTRLYMNLWNEIADSVGAEGVYYLADS